MEWTVAYQAEHGILIVKTEGVADRKSIMELLPALREVMDAHQTGRCLIDHRAITEVQGGITMVYDHVGAVAPQIRAAYRPDYAVKVVEVVRPEHQDHFGFLETVFRNRGIEFLVVQNYDEALRLLMQ